MEDTKTENKPAAARSGACMDCLRKHLLKAEGYAEEMREDASRAWEKRQLLKNLMLAEDHALALGDEAARAAIRSARIAAEGGSYHAASSLYDSLYDPSCGCRKNTVKDVKIVKAENGESQNPVHDFHGEENKGGEF